MQYIPMNVLEYRFSDAGITEQIIVAFQNYQGNEQFNARVSLDQEYVQSINEKLVLDSMNKEQVESFARRKLQDWLRIEREEEVPADE